MSTPVKTARHARGWTLLHAVAQLRAAADRIGERLPCDESVRHRLMRFEAGDRPGPFYRDLLCRVYDTTPAALGWPDTDRRAGDPVAYHTGRTAQAVRWDEVADVDAVTGLLYALPLDTARLAGQARTRLGLYLRLVAADPACPERHTLAAGLRRARAYLPAWLDRDRLAVCERLATALVGNRVRDPAVNVVPDWLTGARLAAASRAAGLFTTTSPAPADHPATDPTTGPVNPGS